MAQPKMNAVRKANEPAPTSIEDIAAEDYTKSMFEDGHNRATHIRNAKAYDEAAHTDGAKDDAVYGNAKEAEALLDNNLDSLDEATPETLLALKQDSTRSRDGTDASGSLDESGGFLGGTTEEVDNLEATATPVDRIPHMND